MQMLLDNRYRIIRTLASGGCGQTYLAEDTRMPSLRKCVIKQLKPIAQNSDSYEIIKERFEREAAILEMASKHSAQIPTLHAYFSENNEFYLVQDWIEGNNLEELVAQQGRHTEERASAILISVLRILTVLHSANVIHRDLKPNNIMVRDRDQLPMLIDFGAVKEVVTTPGLADETSIVIGALPFMPPEQRLGRPVFASDIYSLGLTGIFMVSGKMPQHWQADGVPNHAWQQFAPHVSAGFADVLTRAIEPDLAQRLQSANAMIQALQAVDLNKTIPAPLPIPSPRPEERAQRWPLSFATALIISTIVLILSLAIMYVYFSTQRDRIQSNANLQIANERSLRQTAENDVANIQSLKQQAEEGAAIKQALTDGKIWRAVQIRNDTDMQLIYTLREADGSWTQSTIQPGQIMQHSRQGLSLTIKFDSSFEDGYQEKRYVLYGIPIIGHEPNDAEKGKAAVFNFKKKSTNEIDLYNQGVL
jgi:serine/threonine protein kinase